MLHAQMLNLFHRYKNMQNMQQTLVLATGDGNDNQFQTSFSTVVETVLKEGWHVELWTWENSLNKHYFTIQEKFPDGITINYLDSHRSKITFKEQFKKK